MVLDAELEDRHAIGEVKPRYGRAIYRSASPARCSPRLVDVAERLCQQMDHEPKAMLIVIQRRWK